MSTYKIEAGTAQHIGNRPQQNDRTALYTAAKAPGYVMAVLADGVSGGALASEQVLHTSKHLFDEFRAGDAPSLPRLADLLRNIVREAHDIIKMNPVAATSEPQSTLTILILTPLGQAIWAHVGDSRLYHFHGGNCVLRSNDTAYVKHLVSEDQLPLEAARKHRNSKLLSNVLGSRFKVPYVTIGTHEGLRAGDAFLLCSDGLWQYFTDAELAAVVARNPPRMASEKLINKAIERAQGKGDNCSMAIIKLVAPPKDVPNYTVQKMGRAV
ncbi:PP2C family serine/threonine-protein phosphatase [Rugamonas sp.]|uniref:PP2C family protein-serine/threonine phosphatase n=1 Tax=Rugamonas sp. TaxID=1926287 RepID=UPI0025DF353B|nr:PP2C family serine/threonine-protein phosphatase [Rugamonas sp.]